MVEETKKKGPSVQFMRMLHDLWASDAYRIRMKQRKKPKQVSEKT